MDTNELVKQFCSVTGEKDSDRAKFYLESAAWNIESALCSFYEEPEESVDNQEIRTDRAKTGSTAAGNSMGDLDDSSSEDETQEAFYAGGSEHSGQQVLGPSKKKDMVSMLFKSAREHGAEVVESTEKGKAKKIAFSGTGYKLGQTEDDHEAVASAPKSGAPKPKEVILKLWKSGFTVDQGPMRAFDDPTNKIFLNSVVRGQIPMELIREAKGREVFINMEDHRHEDFQQPKVSTKPFSGAGHSLGSVTPVVVGQVRNTGTEGGAAGDTRLPFKPMENEAKAKEELGVDTAKPTTNLQLKLPDGSRLIVKLNHSHTVSSVRQYVSTSRPELTQFALMTTFPHAELTSGEATIAEAKLLNSTLVIKVK